MKHTHRIVFCLLLLLCFCKPKNEEALEAQAPAVSGKSTSDAAGTAARDTLIQGVLSSENPYQLSLKRAGALHIGMSVAELREMVPASQLLEDHLSLEGQDYRVYKIMTGPNSREVSLIAEELCNPDCKIWRIRVRDPRYRTKEGIGIGSTYGELRQKHPVKYVSMGEQDFVAVSDDLKASFILDSNMFSAAQLASMEKDDVPDNVPITGILLY